MKILVIDYVLQYGVPIAQRLAKDGHEVVYSSVWGSARTTYSDGLGAGTQHLTVDPDGWMNWVKWADVATVTGSEHRGKIVEFLRKEGLPVVGPNKWSCRLELDRSFGHEIFRAMGMKPPESKKFTSVKEALEFLEENPQPYVLKLDSLVRGEKETFVGEDSLGRDVYDALGELMIKLRYVDNYAIYLDEKLDGVEVGIGGWFNGRQIMGDLFVTYEGVPGYGYDLKLKADKLIKKDLLGSILSQGDFHGPFDINGFITKDGVYRPIEWTPRWGCGTTEMFCHSAKDLGKLLFAAAKGEIENPIREELKDKFVALVSTFAGEEWDGKRPIVVMAPEGVDLPILRNDSSFWVTWSGKTEKGWAALPVLLDPTEKIGEYVGVGNTIEEAIKKIEELAKEVKVAESTVETVNALKELTDKSNAVKKYLITEGWIYKLAGDTRRLWDR